jgi:uncharacterized integral membrane protein
MNPDRPRILDLTPPPGIRLGPYQIWRDWCYRTALAVIAAALVMMTGEGPRAVVVDPGLLVLGVAVAVAGWFFFVWVAAWRWLFLGLAGLGWLFAVAAWPPWAFGAWLAAASIMAAKETHCFRFWSGRLIPWISLAVAVADLWPVPASALRAGVGVLAVLWAALAFARWRLPLLRLSAESSQPAGGTRPPQ